MKRPVLIKSKSQLDNMNNTINTVFADDFIKYRYLLNDLENKKKCKPSSCEDIEASMNKIKNLEEFIINKAVEKYRCSYLYIDPECRYIQDNPDSPIPYYYVEVRVAEILANIKIDALKSKEDFSQSNYFDLMYFEPSRMYEEDITNPLYVRYLIRQDKQKLKKTDNFYTGDKNKDRFLYDSFKGYADEWGHACLSYYLKESDFDHYERLAYWLAKGTLMNNSSQEQVKTIVEEMNHIERLTKYGDIEKKLKTVKYVPHMKTAEIIQKLVECKKRAYTRAVLGLYSEELLYDYETELNTDIKEEEKYSLRLIPFKNKK